MAQFSKRRREGRNTQHKRHTLLDAAALANPKSAFPNKAVAQKRCYSPAAMTLSRRRAGKGSMALLQHCPSIAHHQLRHGRWKTSTTNCAFYLHPPHPRLHCQLLDWTIYPSVAAAHCQQ
eukprot:15209013-Ditylum_brightwellii.AAC.1